MARRDVDWTKARAEYEAGASLGAIGRRFAVTRQAVGKRQKREQWARSPDAEALARTDTARRLERPATPQERRLAAGTGKRSLSMAQRLLDMLALGSTVSLAAKRLGMDRGAIADWLAQDAALAALVEQAQAEYAAKLVEGIGEAAARDWRAGLALLDRLPVSRDEYQALGPGAAPGGPGVTINLVLPGTIAAPLQQRAAGPTIDHFPTSESD